MELLPLEIMAEVCSFSDFGSLKKIRLVSTAFAQIAPRYLFEEIYVTLIPEYLDKLTEVAIHPTLRFHVRTLFFDYDILNEEFAEYDVWKAEVDSGGPISIGGGPGAEVNAPADLDCSHQNFCRLLSSQKALFDGRMDLEFLIAAFALLPNLRDIYSMAMQSSTTPYYSIRRRKNGMDPVLSALQRDTLLPKPFVDTSVSTQTGLSRPLASLLSGLGLTRKQIYSIVVADIAWSFWKQDGPSGFQHVGQELIDAAFQQLKNMYVILVVDAYDLEVRLQGMLPLSISTFIGAAKRLQWLTLEFGCYAKDEDGAGFDNNIATRSPRAGQLFAKLTLPCLVTLHFGNCILTEEILIGFMKRHSTTLKYLHLVEVDLDNQSMESTSWAETLKQIAPILALETVNLLALRSDDIENVIVADTNGEACNSRVDAYCKGLTRFLRNRGQTGCPRILDFAAPTG
ncbi:hypothetical protein IMSHALPRED_010164 [Imshaugia aleurites]|uniref:F-box domain-containing protein n=1 Tax=Imshaugia aleurites TaxID=172621 RepID=A0A8H3G8Y9_9LECA|nr:hypothetical protein IMSHALPRED_010164 [Imshaugia aleurites]